MNLLTFVLEERQLSFQTFDVPPPQHFYVSLKLSQVMLCSSQLFFQLLALLFLQLHVWGGFTPQQLGLFHRLFINCDRMVIQIDEIVLETHNSKLEEHKNTE